jgi:outer membrane protein
MHIKIIRGAVAAGLFFCFASGAFAEDKVYTLEDAYQAALGGNENVKIAEEGVVQADSVTDQAWTYFYPRLVGKSGYTRFNETLPPQGGSFLFQPYEQFQAALVLTQPLYTGGRTLAAFRTAQKLQETSRSGLSQAKQDTLLKVAEAYYGVLKAQKTIEISSRSLERMERHKHVTEREAATRKSKTNKSALLRADTLVSQARINLIRAQDGLATARERLSLQSKLPQNALVTEPKAPDQPAAGLDELIASSYQNRDDYTRSKLNQSIASENITLVRGAHYPQLYAEAGLIYQDSHPDLITDTQHNYHNYYGGLRLQIPIFEGGLMNAEVSEARSKLRQTQLSSDFLKQSVETEVREAYVNLRTITSVLGTAKQLREYAKDNFDTVEGLFSEGLVTSLSLIDAEQALNTAEHELMNATYDRDLAVLRLRKSVGTFVKNQNNEIEPRVSR